MTYKISGFARWQRGVRALFRWAKFSFACQKRTRKAPATFEAREARIKGCSPLIIPMERSKRKKASRFAKTGCGSQRLLRYRSHPAGRGPNSSSLFPPLAAVVAVAHFSHFSDLRLRRGCYVSAGLYVQQRRKVCCGAANRRRLKMRLRDLRANTRISSILSWSPPLRGY